MIVEQHHVIIKSTKKLSSNSIHSNICIGKKIRATHKNLCTRGSLKELFARLKKSESIQMQNT